jgi:hypothetical protein
MTCRCNNWHAVVVSDVTIEMTHCYSYTATLLQTLPLNNVDDISISRMVVIVKCFDACCCLTRSFNRSERELRSCEREGHPSFASSDQALQACTELHRFAGMTNRFHDWPKGIADYSPPVLLLVSQQIPTGIGCNPSLLIDPNLN